MEMLGVVVLVLYVLVLDPIICERARENCIGA